MYDIFISCKSEDYNKARDIYNFLTDNGHKVFMADEELRKKGITEYAAAIDSALESAKHLILYTSRLEYVNSTYVKYEWRTFLNEKNSGRKPDGNILTILKGVKPGDLPIGLRQFQSIEAKNYRDVLNYVATARGEGHAPGQNYNNRPYPAGNYQHTDWMIWAIVGTVLGFLCSCIGVIFGIIAITKANKANILYAEGRIEEARTENSSAKTMTIVSLVLAALGVFVLFLYVLFVEGV